MNRFIQRIPGGRKIALLLVSLALVGTGFSSLAALNDSLTAVGNMSVQHVDLQLANDTGTPANVAISKSIQFTGETTDRVNWLINVGNSGNTRFALSAVQSGGSAATWANNITATAYSVAAASNCPTSGNVPTGTKLTNNPVPPIYSGNLIPPAPDTGPFHVNAGGSALVCINYARTGTVAGSETNTHTIQFNAEAAPLP